MCYCFRATTVVLLLFVIVSERRWCRTPRPPLRALSRYCDIVNTLLLYISVFILTNQRLFHCTNISVVTTFTL